MATNKKTKKLLKPEYSIKVVAKKKPNPKKQKVAAPAKKPPKVSYWSKLSKEKRLKYIFIVACLIIISVSFIAVSISLKRTNDALNNAAAAADSFDITDVNELQKAKLIGSNEQLTKEIDNYATSPADLQNYALKDYRQLKQKCIVNGQIYGSLSYGIASVADAQYAQIKRNCNGEQTQILKKFGEKWTIVHEGNNPPLCSLVNDLMIPQRVSLQCMVGGTTYLNPNP